MLFSCLPILYIAVLPKIPHSISCKRVPNRPLRPRRGRFGTLLQLLECGIYRRTAAYRPVCIRATWLEHCSSHCLRRA